MLERVLVATAIDRTDSTSRRWTPIASGISRTVDSSMRIGEADVFDLHVVLFHAVGPGFGELDARFVVAAVDREIVRIVIGPALR